MLEELKKKYVINTIHQFEFRDIDRDIDNLLNYYKINKFVSRMNIYHDGIECWIHLIKQFRLFFYPTTRGVIVAQKSSGNEIVIKDIMKNYKTTKEFISCFGGFLD